MVSKAATVWLTGLPASGKSTIANLLAKRFQTLGLEVEVLDGDEIRKIISSDLGFSLEDRMKNVVRVAHICRLLVKHKVIVIVALVSPLRLMRDEARKIIGDFVEVWVNCPVQVCKERDPKGMYALAMNGKLPNFTGVGQAYEEPLNAEIVIDTEKNDTQKCVDKLFNELKQLGIL